MKVVPLVLAFAAPMALHAQAPAPATWQSTVARVVESVATVTEENYVFPDTGRMVADHLRRRLRDGAYGSVTESGQLADRLTVDMQAVNGDRHLYVNYAGRAGSAGGSAAAGPQMVMRRPGEPPPPDALAAGRRANFDINAVQRLPGNVGYLSVFQLSSRGSEEAFAVIDAAMAFLERTDAIIVDLRQTAGGEPRMADYLASYFFGPEPVPTLNSYRRRSDQTVERTTVRVGGTRRPTVPVFLLVGQGTASGTEDFAFILKQSGRGTLVGGRTAGAGRLNAIFPLSDGFTASVSGGRTYDPRTGKEWERTGIEPDIASGDSEALAVAHAAALERVAAETVDPALKRALGWTRAVVLAKAKPVAIPETAGREYAGEYDQRLVRFANDTLWYQRSVERPKEMLVPVEGGVFALGEATRVEFVRASGRVTGMKIVSPMGQESTFPRTR